MISLVREGDGDEVRVLLKRLDERASVLDVGCGAGVLMFWSNFGLAEYLGMLMEVGFQVLGVGTTGGGWGIGWMRRGIRWFWGGPGVV